MSSLSVTRARSYTILDVELDADCGPQVMLVHTPCIRLDTPSITLHRYEDVPKFLRGNPYIKYGYRVCLPASQCFSSLFLWSNESVNIWSHLVGFFIFFFLMVSEWLTFSSTSDGNSAVDAIYTALGLVCYQVCMLLSAFYHLLYCHSEKACRRWLSLDLAGICIGLVGCYLPAVHLAFYCHQIWRDFYILVIVCIGVATLGLQFHPRFVTDSWSVHRMILYCCVAGYGVVPTLHWIYLSGGLQADIVQMFAGKVMNIYVLGAFALMFYVSKFPESLFPGKMDFIGSSHQCWHVIVVISFAYWYHASKSLRQYHMEKPCVL